MLRGSDGKLYPTDNCMIWIASTAIMRDRAFYPEPHKFIPQRFQPSSPFPQVDRAAFRPFEKGSRDCIGQELAMLESRILLAMTIRQFNFQEAFEELDQRLGRKPKPCGDILDAYGGRAYQILSTTGKPKDGIPMWVTHRKAKE